MKKIKRKTLETKIKIKVNKKGKGEYSINTGIGFFNHMLETLSKHSGIDINIECKGDIHIDFHHTVEDCGIVLGKVLKKELFPIKNIERFGHSSIPMDESLCECSIDLSNRPYLFLDLKETKGIIKDFDIELVYEFFSALISNLSITTHIELKRGENKHHIVESCFKSFAVALKNALKKNKKVKVPSTKGKL